VFLYVREIRIQQSLVRSNPKRIQIGFAKCLCKVGIASYLAMTVVDGIR